MPFMTIRLQMAITVTPGLRNEGRNHHRRTFNMGGDCQKTSSQILTSACIKMTFSGLLKTQEAYFEIKIHGEKNKT